MYVSTYVGMYIPVYIYIYGHSSPYLGSSSQKFNLIWFSFRAFLLFIHQQALWLICGLPFQSWQTGKDQDNHEWCLVLEIFTQIAWKAWSQSQNCYVGFFYKSSNNTLTHWKLCYKFIALQHKKIIKVYTGSDCAITHTHFRSQWAWDENLKMALLSKPRPPIVYL